MKAGQPDFLVGCRVHVQPVRAAHMPDNPQHDGGEGIYEVQGVVRRDDGTPMYAHPAIVTVLDMEEYRHNVATWMKPK